MSIGGIEAIGGFTPLFPQGVNGVSGAGSVGGAQSPDGPSGAEFGQLLTDGIDRLEGLHDKTDALAVQAATGDLTNIHDYTIAATESSVATQLTVAVRNKAVEAFNEIMRMQV
jgi:flagellar hook-basal body complex protein FliE